MKPCFRASCKNESNSVPCRPTQGRILRPSKGVLVKKLLTAFAFGAMIAGAAAFVTSPALAADTGTTTGGTDTGTGTGTAKKTHHHKSHHHHKKSGGTGTSSGTSGSAGTTSGTTSGTTTK